MRSRFVIPFLSVTVALMCFCLPELTSNTLSASPAEQSTFDLQSPLSQPDFSECLFDPSSIGSFFLNPIGQQFTPPTCSASNTAEPSTYLLSRRHKQKKKSKVQVSLAVPNLLEQSPLLRSDREASSHLCRNRSWWSLRSSSQQCPGGICPLPQARSTSGHSTVVSKTKTSVSTSVPLVSRSSTTQVNRTAASPSTVRPSSGLPTVGHIDK